MARAAPRRGPSVIGRAWARWPPPPGSLHTDQAHEGRSRNGWNSPIHWSRHRRGQQQHQAGDESPRALPLGFVADQPGRWNPRTAAIGRGGGRPPSRGWWVLSTLSPKCGWLHWCVLEVAVPAVSRWHPAPSRRNAENVAGPAAHVLGAHVDHAFHPKRAQTVAVATPVAGQRRSSNECRFLPMNAGPCRAWQARCLICGRRVVEGLSGAFSQRREAAPRGAGKWGG